MFRDWVKDRVRDWVMFTDWVRDRVRDWVIYVGYRD